MSTQTQNSYDTLIIWWILNRYSHLFYISLDKGCGKTAWLVPHCHAFFSPLSAALRSTLTLKQWFEISFFSPKISLLKGRNLFYYFLSLSELTNTMKLIMEGGDEVGYFRSNVQYISPLISVLPYKILLQRVKISNKHLKIVLKYHYSAVI